MCTWGNGYIEVMLCLMSKKDITKNSSMVQNEEELKIHSKLMGNMETKQTVQEIKKQPDPVQHDKKKTPSTKD